MAVQATNDALRPERVASTVLKPYCAAPRLVTPETAQFSAFTFTPVRQPSTMPLEIFTFRPPTLKPIEVLPLAPVSIEP